MDSAEPAPGSPQLWTRRKFIETTLKTTAGLAVSGPVFNSLIGESRARRNPDLPPLEGSLSEYSVGWNARPWVWANLAVASSFTDGHVIRPGEEVSIIDILRLSQMDNVSRQNTDPRKGYIAAQMSDPRKLDGWGYGLCLSSTSLYRAALDSPLLVTGRGTHYDKYPSYFQDPKYPVGTDAAVYEPDEGDPLPRTDLKLKNPTRENLRLRFEVFDDQGNKIDPPDSDMPQTFYKATYLDQAVKVLRRKIATKSGIELPQQAIPEYAFGNRRIFVRAAVESDSPINFKVERTSPVGVTGDPDNVTFARKVVLHPGSGEEQMHRETHTSQYGKSPIEGDILAVSRAR